MVSAASSISANRAPSSQRTARRAPQLSSNRTPRRTSLRTSALRKPQLSVSGVAISICVQEEFQFALFRNSKKANLFTDRVFDLFDLPVHKPAVPLPCMPVP